MSLLASGTFIYIVWIDPACLPDGAREDTPSELEVGNMNKPVAVRGLWVVGGRGRGRAGGGRVRSGVCQDAEGDGGRGKGRGWGRGRGRKGREGSWK